MRKKLVSTNKHHSSKIEIKCEECKKPFLRFPSELSAGSNYCSWVCRKLTWSKTKKSGVYIIRHVESGKTYVGSSQHIHYRWYTHKYKLEKGKHDNNHLQGAWTLYGPDAFEWVIVEEVQILKHRIQAEQKWIDALRSSTPEHGYNIVPLAGSRQGFKHSEKTKHKIAEAQKGRRHTADTIRRMKLNRGDRRPGSKLTERIVSVIKYRLMQGELHRVIASDYGVGRTAIGEIHRGVNWGHVAPAQSLGCNTPNLES